jgi:hypothetical protein
VVSEDGAGVVAANRMGRARSEAGKNWTMRLIFEFPSKSLIRGGRGDRDEASQLLSLAQGMHGVPTAVVFHSGRRQHVTKRILLFLAPHQQNRRAIPLLLDLGGGGVNCPVLDS